MSQQGLDRAYELIKEGREEEAISVLEPLIRLDRDNSDAWWLLANATRDPSAKRNALQNVLRIGGSSVREEKARSMLTVLDNDSGQVDIFNFDQPREKMKFQGQPAVEYPSEKRRGGGGGCIKTLFAMVAIALLCTCGACFGLSQLSGFSFDDLSDLSNIIALPSDYTDMGFIEPGQTIQGNLSTGDDSQVFNYLGRAGETLTLHITTDGDIPPIAMVYGEDGNIVTSMQFNMNQDSTDSFANTTTVQFTTDGDYRILIRSFLGIGVGNFELKTTSSNR